MPSSMLLAAAAVLLCSFANGAPIAPISAVKRQGGWGHGSGPWSAGKKIRGVNLGGWFVLEPWITPSIFEATPDNVVDEWTFGATLGKDEAEKRLQQHWSTWITENDFHEIASLGLGVVRLPIGYWSVLPIEGDPYVQGAYKWLGKALDWAEAAGIMVMIDLHGAPGSQNGFDNSGHKGPIEWGTGDTVDHTLKTLKKISDDHASHPAVASIELLNEPAAETIGLDVVKQFYYDGWGDLKGNGKTVTFHDAFEGPDGWNDWGDGLTNLMEDTHHYEVFDDDTLTFSLDEHLSSVSDYGDQMASSKWPTVAGEWSGALTDCAKWLNGRGVGARYDGTYEGSSYVGSCDGKASGTVAALSSEDKSNIQTFVKAQIESYEKAAGWIFWTWHTEAAPEWDFQSLAANGLISL